MDALRGELEGCGIRVKPSWLSGCAAHLEGTAPGFCRASVEEKAKYLLQQLLQNDFNQCGAATLPPGVQGLHDTVLPGKLVLQVVEVVNIGTVVRERYSGNDSASRCLKLLLTDGVQRVAGMEYRPTPALHSAMPAGTKVVLQNVAVRRGILLLTPQTCAVLGGQVAQLEEARLRMVAHWTQPAVGKRGPPLTMQQAAAEASRAAWADGSAPSGNGGPPPPQQQVQYQGANAQHHQPLGQGNVQGISQQTTQQMSQQQQQQQQHILQARPGGPSSGRLQAAHTAAMAQPTRGETQAQQQQQQQQQQEPLPAHLSVQGPAGPSRQHSGSGRSISLGLAVEVPPRQQQSQHPPQPQQQQNQHDSGQSFSFGCQGRQQQQQQAATGVGNSGTLVGARPPAAAAPLQERNRSEAASGGAKRSRLALPKHPSQQGQAALPGQQPADMQTTAADFSFAQPLQQQQQRQQNAFLIRRPAMQSGQVYTAPLQRLRTVAAGVAAAPNGGLAAGTDDDPICLSDDEHQQQHGPGCGAGTGLGTGCGSGPADVEMADSTDHDIGWEAADELDWEGEDPPEPEPQLEPWERGFDADEPEAEGLRADEGGEADGEGQEEGDAAEGEENVEELDDEQHAAGEMQQEDGPGSCQDAQQQQQQLRQLVADPSSHSSAGRREMLPISGNGRPANGDVVAAGSGEDGWDDEDGEEQHQQQEEQDTGAGRNAASTASLPDAAQQACAPVQGAAVALCPRRRSGQAAEQAQHQQQHQSNSPAHSAPFKATRLAMHPSDSKLDQHQSAQLGADPPQQQQQQPQSEVLKLEPLDPNLLNAAPSLAEVLYSSEPTPPKLTHVPLQGGAAAVPAQVEGQKTSAIAGPAGAAVMGLSPVPSPLSSTPLSSALAGQLAAGRTGGLLPTMPSLQASAKSRVTAAPSLPSRQGPTATAMAAPPIAAFPAAVTVDSDDDMPSFDLLPNLSPAKSRTADTSASSADEPFIYLLQLSQRAAVAGPSAFPLTATIFGTVKSFVGPLQFKSPETGEPQYIMQMMVEDGSMVVAARMGAQFLRDFLELAPDQFEASLADPCKRQEVAQLAQSMIELLASYSGLMAVRLEAPGAQLEVVDLLCDMKEEQLGAFQRRATRL